MRYAVFSTALILTALLVFACGGSEKHHKADMPDPAGFNAHFDDIDKNGDGEVKYIEFVQYFPEAEPEVFMALDLNDDGVVDHDEWHQFKETHGLEHK